MELKDVQARLVKALDEAEQIRAQYAGKATVMSGEEIARWQSLLDEGDGLKQQIDLMKREAAIKAWAAEAQPMVGLAAAATKAGAPQPEGQPKGGQTVAVKAFGEWLRWGRDGVKDADGLKALESDIGAAGGFLVVPQELVQRLIVLVKDMVFMRQFATVQVLDRAQSLGVPVLDTDLSDPVWTSEVATGNEDTVQPFGKRELEPHPLAKLIRISNKLLRQASIDPEAVVMDRLAYRFARVEENTYLNGSGANQPLGIFVASPNGIDTSRDTLTASVGTLKGDDLLALKYGLKAQYWPRARWMLHRTTLLAVRQLKDSQGQYLWQPGLGGYVAQGTALIGAQPDMLVGQPVMMSELAPNTVASGNYIAVLGDFSFYWIADALNMQIQRVVELYALSNQTGFIGRKETDGMPVLAEAFARLKVQ